MKETRRVVPLVKVQMPERALLIPMLEEVLYSGLIGEGEYVYRFEAAFESTFGLSNIVAMNSGTAALHTALILAGVGVGSEVISTSMTAEPTNTTILAAGAVPVFADVDPDTGNLSPDSVLEKITPRTKAICVVHYAGYPARLDELREIADAHDLYLIEDCAHALGARYKGRAIGTIGDFAIFSLQAIKHMTTVDGGVLRMQDKSYMDKAKQIRWFGLTRNISRTEVDIKILGYKYNMNNVTAALGLVQLQNIKQILSAYIENGTYFNRQLAGIAGITPAHVSSSDQPTYWLYTMLCDKAGEVMERLHAAGFQASKLHRPNHLHTIFGNSAGSLPGLDQFYSRLVHIPCGWWVSAADRERLVDILGRGPT